MNPHRSVMTIGRLVTAVAMVSIALGVVGVSHDGARPTVVAQASPFVAPVTLDPSSGDSATTFDMQLPGGAACGGTGVDGYRFHTFLIPAGTDIATVTFNAFGPSVGETPLTSTFAQIRNRNPEISPVGLINRYEATHTMTGYDPTFRPVAGQYQLGVACTLSENVTEYWSETITLTDDASDTGAAGFVWSAGAVAASPSAPTNVSADASDGAVSVSFDAVTATPAVDTYEVTADDGQGGMFTATGAGSPISVDGLTNGTEYDITVTATNTEGTSAPSSPAVSATPEAAPVAPEAPTDVSAATADGELVISFTPAATGPTADSFTVRAVDGGNESTATGTSSPITIDGLTNGTEYTVTVTATAGGLDSQPSTAITATPAAPAAVPDAPTLDRLVPGDGTLTAEFTPATTGDAATTYTMVAAAVVDGDLEVTVFVGSSSPLTMENLTNGVEYDVVVTGSNAIGDSPESNRLFGIPAPIPGVPVIDGVDAGDGQATVRFTPAAGAAATEFVVTATEVTSTGGALVQPITATGTASPIIVVGLDNGVIYDVTLAATNASGTSEASVAFQVTPVDTGGTTGGTTSGTTGGTTSGTTSGTTGGTTGATGSTTSGGTRVLAATGSNNTWIMLWAALLLIVGRMIVLSGRTPRIIDSSER